MVSYKLVPKNLKSYSHLNSGVNNYVNNFGKFCWSIFAKNFQWKKIIHCKCFGKFAGQFLLKIFNGKKLFTKQTATNQN